MKCEYCGEKYAKAKYSEGCRSCYGPKPETVYIPPILPKSEQEKIRAKEGFYGAAGTPAGGWGGGGGGAVHIITVGGGGRGSGHPGGSR